MREGCKNATSGHFVEELRAMLCCLFLLLFDSCCLLYRRPRRSGAKKVLVVRVDAIGDFLLWLDAAKELRTLYPAGEYELTLLGNLAWCDLARRLPHFDRVLPLDRGRFVNSLSYRRSFLQALRKEGFHTVIQPTFSREFFLGDEIVRVSGAPERIGSAGDCTNTGRLGKRLSDRCYTRLIPAAASPVMELERNAEFLRGLGLDGCRASLPDLRFLLTRGTAPLPGAYYLLVPGAGMPIKRWRAANFAELAGRLHRLTGWPGLVCGSAEEQGLADRLVREAGVPLENRAGGTSLIDLAALIAGAQVVIGNDSAAIHLAAALGVPAVSVLAGAQYGRFLPYRVSPPPGSPLPLPVVHRMDCFGCDWRCSQGVDDEGAAPCVARITVDAVFEAVCAVLALGELPSGERV